jgi:hypothetical protein
VGRTSRLVRRFVTCLFWSSCCVAGLGCRVLGPALHSARWVAWQARLGMVQRVSQRLARRAPLGRPARHVRDHTAEAHPDAVADGFVAGPYRASGPPTTIALVISRRARREAVTAAALSATTNPRLRSVERLLAGMQAAACALALTMSVVSWMWLAARGSVAGQGSALTNQASGGLVVAGPFQPLLAVSGTALTLIMLLISLLLAPVVNPFYAAPADRRWLHAATSSVFAVLAVTTVAVIARAAR